MKLSVEETFPYPIGILLFNSPEYSEIVLRSLSSQDIKVDPSRVVITVDGYTNSKDEAVGKDNQVDQVIKIAEKRKHSDNILYSTGPQLLTYVYLINKNKINVLPSKLFNPHNKKKEFNNTNLYTKHIGTISWT